MEELIRTTDPVTIAFVEALLKEARIGYFVADRAVSAVQGMIGSFPCRVMVACEDAAAARCLMADAGLGGELRPEKAR